jgi:tight adherence protein C
VQLVVVCGLILTYGIATPYLLIRRRANKRKKQIERALPDALDLLMTCVEAGLGVDAAISVVAQRTKGPLSEKLTEYLKQVGLGQSRREALEDIASSSGARGLTRLAAVVAQATTVGTTMGDVLRIQSAELRENRRLAAREAAARAPIWMTIPLALCFMPAMGAVIVVPSVLHLLDSIGKLGLR